MTRNQVRTLTEWMFVVAIVADGIWLIAGGPYLAVLPIVIALYVAGRYIDRRFEQAEEAS